MISSRIAGQRARLVAVRVRIVYGIRTGGIVLWSDDACPIIHDLENVAKMSTIFKRCYRHSVFVRNSELNEVFRPKGGKSRMNVATFCISRLLTEKLEVSKGAGQNTQSGLSYENIITDT